MDDLTGAIGTWTSLSDPAVAEIAAAEFDFVVVDTEHTALGLETVADCIRAVDAGGSQAVVRTPWNDPVRIKRLLDLGPDGLLVPMIDDGDAAHEAVAATRYPPEGIRGLAAARASDYGREIGPYVHETHRDLTLIPQVETEAGVENVDDIATTEGVDALFVGPADLSAALGVFGEWTNPVLSEAMETVVDAGDDAGIPVGTLGVTPEQVRALGSVGFDYMIAGADTAHLVAGGKRARDAAEDAI